MDSHVHSVVAGSNYNPIQSTGGPCTKNATLPSFLPQKGSQDAIESLESSPYCSRGPMKEPHVNFNGRNTV